jgi:YidC/Oxa1 family membrane protein insertase
MEDGSYTLEYNIAFQNMGPLVAGNTKQVTLDWINHLNKLEKNVNFEKMYSTVYYHEIEEGTDYCSCTGDDENIIENQIKWVSNANQFFSSNLIAATNFNNGRFTTTSAEDEDPILKTLTSTMELPISNFNTGNFDMKFYIGPNDFDNLEILGSDLSDIVPFGWSIFGTINRWVIRPLFKFLSSYIGNMGIVILILTFIVKGLVFPLTYKMLHSQSKMAALKPVTAGIKEKYKDDMQKQQMESMKIYREYGVNPMGGCFPMVLQMPIWFALYRFFPASIEFRQASFLWANDLSTFDSFFNLPFSLPMMGSHISLFTLLWVISLLAYTWYNMRHNLDMSTAMNPMMKNMQFIMPVMFFVFLNQYAAGLTCYLLFSNVINIGQTIGTKNFLINEEKIKAQLKLNKEKPKKKTGFQARLANALEEQKKVVEEKQKKQNRKR